MEHSIVIRRTYTDDADNLLELSRTTFFEAFAHLNEPCNMEVYASAQFTAEFIIKQLKEPGSAFYFAIADDQVAGYMKLNRGYAQTEFQHSEGLEVERIYILAGYQGRQIGRQLIDFAINQALLNNLKLVWLGVWEHNTRAIRFYQRHGFEVFDSHNFMLGNDRQVDLLMRRLL